MTIFFEVLQDFITEALTELAKGTKDKAEGLVGFFHNSELSGQQALKCTALSRNILTMPSTEDDHDDYNAAVELIRATRINIQTIRRKMKKPENEGETIQGFNDLLTHVQAFFEKICAISADFDLLNKRSISTPENIVYKHAVRYFAGKIFHPLRYPDENISDAKEKAVIKRLQMLKKLISPEATFEEQKEQTELVLADLARDNVDITRGGETGGYGLPVVAAGGVEVKIPLDRFFAAGPGLLATEFGLAARSIEELTPESFAAILSRSGAGPAYAQ